MPEGSIIIIIIIIIMVKNQPSIQTFEGCLWPNKSFIHTKLLTTGDKISIISVMILQ